MGIKQPREEFEPFLVHGTNKATTKKREKKKGEAL
jgi:hypothetical protein